MYRINQPDSSPIQIPHRNKKCPSSENLTDSSDDTVSFSDGDKDQDLKFYLWRVGEANVEFEVPRYYRNMKEVTFGAHGVYCFTYLFILFYFILFYFILFYLHY